MQSITICSAVFILPHIPAAITIPLSAATRRKPLIINSLAIITITIQHGILSSSINAIIADETRSLSASGSINFPKLVTRLYFLAILPSSISVIEANANIKSAIQFPYGIKPPYSLSHSNAIKKNGISTVLRIVSLLGKFIPFLLFLFSSIISLPLFY